MARLWDKGEVTDDDVLRFCVGNDHELDERLVRHDVVASVAHARMLSEQGHLSADDFAAIEAGLNELAAQHARGEWTISFEEEDCHTALEGRLVDAIGEAGERVHLGRSRNDQVLAALRLFMKEETMALAEGAAGVVAALNGLVERQGNAALPGYTHMQRAMPSTVGLWAGAWIAEIEDDIAGLEAALRRADKNPLGSAAGYGTPGLDLNRDRTTELLGFAETHAPVTAVQLSRGKAEASIAFELTMLLQDIGRLAADVVLFATAEFAFLRLAGEHTTGSSIMPQKRNPDVFELVRAHAAEASSDLFAILQVTSKMTSGYHRDLQLVKASLFRAIDRAHDVLGVVAHVLAGVVFDEESCAAAIDGSMLATERANRAVVETGCTFRAAYRQAAREVLQDGIG